MRHRATHNKLGIASGDVYQLVTYAVRLGVPKVVLLYPCGHGRQPQPASCLQIPDRLAGGRSITLYVCELPVTFRELSQADATLRDRFAGIFRQLGL